MLQCLSVQSCHLVTQESLSVLFQGSGWRRVCPGSVGHFCHAPLSTTPFFIATVQFFPTKYNQAVAGLVLKLVQLA